MTKSHTRKVLVVEDNELNMRLFCDLLDAFGFETFAFGSLGVFSLFFAAPFALGGGAAGRLRGSFIAGSSSVSAVIAADSGKG